MTTLAPGKTVRSANPVLEVDNQLEPGRWRFRLTVVDDKRNESEAAELIVTVARGRSPVPPIRPLEPLAPASPRGRLAAVTPPDPKRPG